MIRDFAAWPRNAGAHYWIDYCCLPQRPRTFKEQELFERALSQIASIQSKCTTVILGGPSYGTRMWCWIEHYAATLFSQLQSLYGTDILSLLDDSEDASMLERTQFLEEPPWDTLHVTDPADVSGIKFNYTWLTNLAKFELWDRMHELQLSLPGRLSGGVAWAQAAFGLEYASSVEALRSLFLEHGGDVRLFFKKNSLLWLARRFSWSPTPDQDYSIDGLRFSKFVLHSTELVAWIALLLGIIRLANRDQTRIIELRELYSKIVLLSLFR